MQSSSDFVQKIVAGEELNDLVDDAVESLSKGRHSFLDILQSLEPFLTNVDYDRRSSGVQFMADVLEKLPSDFLGPEETSALTGYFIGKLDEHFSITPHILRALSLLVGTSTFPSSQVTTLLANLQNHITVQTLTQPSRLSYYEILHKLLQNFEDVLISKPSDFVHAIVSGMDSEGDPRNLMFLFQFIPEAYNRFPLQLLAEEAFSVLECYFPIDFTPKGDGVVNREALAQGVENCFLSSKEFGQFVFPMVLEKLSSSLKVAQTDSLKLLIRGFDESYDIADINPHVGELWRAMQALLLQAGDSEPSTLALTALVSLLRRYSSSALNSSESETLDRVLKFITDNTHRFLSDPTLTLFLPSIRILSGVSQASRLCSEYVVTTVVPQLLALVNGKKSHDIVLTALSSILTSCVRYDLWNSGETKTILDSVPPTLVNSLGDASSQNGCFLCLTEIVATLSSECRRNVYKATLHFLSSNDPLPEESYSKCLLTLANTYPEEVREQLLDQISIAGFEPAVQRRKKLLTICWCCNVPALIRYCSDKIGSFIESTSTANEAIDCLREFVTSQPSSQVMLSLGRPPCDLIRRLHRSCSSCSKGSLQSENDIAGLSTILETLVRHLPTEEQSVLVADCLGSYVLGSSQNDSVEIGLLRGLLVALKRDVVVAEKLLIVEVLIRMSLNCDRALARQSSSVLLSSLVNKCQNELELAAILEHVEREIDSGLENEAKVKSVALLAWIVKSLILRNHQSSNVWLRKLIGLLADPDVSSEAAKGFEIILSDSSELSSNNFCCQRLLFKQWVFQWIFDEQMDKLFNDEETRKAAALAISYVVIGVPTALVVTEIKKLIKVFVLSLESHNVGVVSATLGVLSRLLSTERASLESYVDDLIDIFLRLCSSDSMLVRMNALDCLYYCGQYPEIKLLPQKNKVVLELGKSIDDRKRLVRQKAARARSRWFLIGTTDDR